MGPVYETLTPRAKAIPVNCVRRPRGENPHSIQASSKWFDRWSTHVTGANGRPRYKAKTPHQMVGGFQEIPAATYSPRGGPPSTIGAGGLDCCVRYGNRYISTAITTGNHALTTRVANRRCRSLSVLERARTSNSKPSAD